MTESNRKLGRILLIFGIAVWGLVWLVVFNSGAAGSAIAEEKLKNLTFFQAYSLEAMPEGIFTQEDVKGYDVVVYNGWGPWCHNCVDEIPYLEQLSREYKDKGILVVGIVADYNTQIQRDAEYGQKVMNVVEAYNITYPVVLSDERFYEEVYPTMGQSFPTTWVTDKDGNLIDFFIGGKSEAEWRSLFEKWAGRGDGSNE